jgi:uncharacterized protein
MKTKLFILTCVLFLSFRSAGFAETIYLRDGRVVKEKIVERGPYYIITMTGNMPRKYFTGQIDHIEDDDPQEAVHRTNMDAAPFEGISGEKAGLIMSLIEISGVRRNMEQNIEQVIARASEESRKEFEELFNIDGIIERLIPVYDKYYSEEEIKEIIRFYESPAGQKVLEATPQIMKESLGVSVQYLRERASP